MVDLVEYDACSRAPIANPTHGPWEVTLGRYGETRCMLCNRREEDCRRPSRTTLPRAKVAG